MIQSVKNIPLDNLNDEINIDNNSDPDDVLDKDNIDPFESYLRSCSSSTSRNTNTFTSNNAYSIKILLNGYKNVKRLVPYTSNVFNYCRDQKDSMPQLYELSQVLLAVPATQVGQSFFVIFA